MPSAGQLSDGGCDPGPADLGGVARMGPDDVQTMLGWRAGKEPNRTGRFVA